MRQNISRVATSVALLTTLLHAQARPNFSGAWISIPDERNPSATNELLISQTANELIIESRASSGPQKMVYKLDGSETTNKILGRAGAPETVAASTASWEGDKLVIRTPLTRGVPPQTRTIQFRQVFSLEPDGRLVIEQTASLAEGGPTETNRLVFRKR